MLTTNKPIYMMSTCKLTWVSSLQHLMPTKKSIQITSPSAIYKEVTHELVQTPTKWGGKQCLESVPQTRNYSKQN
jgi:hypothetical protein